MMADQMAGIVFVCQVFLSTKGWQPQQREISIPYSLVHCSLFHYGQRSSNLILKPTYPAISYPVCSSEAHFSNTTTYSKPIRKRQKQSNMCIKYRFYHLCGHTHRVTTFPCTYAP